MNLQTIFINSLFCPFSLFQFQGEIIKYPLHVFTLFQVRKTSFKVLAKAFNNTKRSSVNTRTCIGFIIEGLKWAPKGYKNANGALNSILQSFTDARESLINIFESFTDVRQPSTGIRQSLTGIHQSLIGIPQSFTGIPQSLTGISQLFTGIPQSLIGIHQLLTGIPQSLTGMHQSLQHTLQFFKKSRITDQSHLVNNYFNHHNQKFHNN